MKVQPAVAAVKIQKFVDDEMNFHDDLLAAEEPMEIRIAHGEHNHRSQMSIAVTMRTPGNDFELATGFLFTEGVIKSYDDILSIRYCVKQEEYENIVHVELNESVVVDAGKLERHFYTTSSCGICGKTSIDAVKVCIPEQKNSALKISNHLITQLPQMLRSEQSVFKFTGGLHASALFNVKGDLILSREDIGRHNALDKLIGAGLASHLSFNEYILLLSGRASFELMQKAAMAQIPVVAAVGAPSALAVKMAEETGITLIGFLRDNRFNIYTNPERIIVAGKEKQL